MKKLSTLLMFALGVSLLFTACKKDEEDDDANGGGTAPASQLGTATITGKALARIDLSNDTTTAAGNRLQTGNYANADSVRWENAPAGTVLYATIDTDSLTINGSGTGAKKIYTATVDAAGNYSFTIDANVLTVAVTITGDEFLADEIQFTKAKQKIQSEFFLSPDEVKVNVNKGQKKNQTLYYEGSALYKQVRQN